MHKPPDDGSPHTAHSVNLYRDILTWKRNKVIERFQNPTGPQFSPEQIKSMGYTVEQFTRYVTVLAISPWWTQVPSWDDSRSPNDYGLPPLGETWHPYLIQYHKVEWDRIDKWLERTAWEFDEADADFDPLVDIPQMQEPYVSHLIWRIDIGGDEITLTTQAAVDFYLWPKRVRRSKLESPDLYLMQHGRRWILPLYEVYAQRTSPSEETLPLG